MRKNFRVTALYENQKLVELHCEPVEATSYLGNIYVGRVKDVVKNINAAFIQYGTDQKGYLSLDDVIAPIYTKKNASTVICQGDEVLVQVKKEPVRSKDAVLTTNLNLAGQFLAVTSENNRIGISKKIVGDRRKELKTNLETFQKEHRISFGYVLRTNAGLAEDSEILNEAMQLTQQLSDLIRKGQYLKAYSIVWESPAYYMRKAQGLRRNKEYEFLTDQKEVDTNFREWIKNREQYQHIIPVYYEDSYELTKLLSLETRLKEALSEKVWLKSGAYLVIQQTEALWVVDVNSGKNIRKKSKHHFLDINLEAAMEVARQIRLRNLSGIVIVDFIDLQQEEERRLLCSTLDAELRKDPIPTNFVDMTKLGLVEITRMKENKPLHEQIYVDEQE